MSHGAKFISMGVFFLKIDVLKKILLKQFFNNENDWSGRCETPVGVAGQVRPRRSDSDELSWTKIAPYS